MEVLPANDLKSLDVNHSTVILLPAAKQASACKPSPTRHCRGALPITFIDA